MSMLNLFRCCKGGCGPQHKFSNGNPDKEVTCGPLGERELARRDTKAKVQLKMLKESICLP